jgi:signal transduction histidine kinase
MRETVRLLVVDDEPGMRLGAERALRGFSVPVPELDGQLEFAVRTAGSGEEALAKVSDADLLLLDHKLPGISGLDVLNALAEKKSDVLTIMITAYASLDTAINATKLGAYDFLAKPFTPEELKAAVRKAARHLVLQRHARRLTEERRRVRFEFISVLAHELKAPLNAIEGNLSLLGSPATSGDPALAGRLVERSVVRLEGMRKLIADLLDLTRIESGEKKRALAEVDVAAVARGVIETMQPQAAQRKIVIELHAPNALPFSADRGEIEIILNNLVSNAVKYNRDAGRVEVTLEDGPAQIAIRVADTGIGMTAAEAAQLFQDFVRIKNEKTRHILGSGLGLSIVKKLATLYDGETSVQSRPDAGSTFTVTLKKAGPAA